MKNKSLVLFGAVKSFLTDYLPNQKGMSPHTIESYRTALNLFLDYWKDKKGCKLYELTFESIPKDCLKDFLQHLEEERGCSVSSRNQRLSALRSFFKYAGRKDLYAAACYTELKSIPLKKNPANKPIEFFSEKALEAILKQPNPKTKIGYRDYGFLLTMYDTGGRVAEIISLTRKSLHLDNDSEGCYVQLLGKGNQKRKVPLMRKTCDFLCSYLEKMHAGKSIDTPLFYVHHRDGDRPLSEDAVEAFVKKYADKARAECPEVPEHMYPHIWRHSRAMHLYRGGMPLTMVAQWLGHAQVNTTVKFYANADTKAKAEAINKATSKLNPMVNEEVKIEWEEDEELLKKLYGLA